jgi:hypothetical protein
MLKAENPAVKGSETKGAPTSSTTRTYLRFFYPKRRGLIEKELSEATSSEQLERSIALSANPIYYSNKCVIVSAIFSQRDKRGHSKYKIDGAITFIFSPSIAISRGTGKVQEYSDTRIFIDRYLAGSASHLGSLACE